MRLALDSHARSALLIVDMQEFFFRQPERRRNLATVVDNINRLVDYFETKSEPVIHIITCFQADGSDWDLKMKASGEAELIEGTADTAILPQIRVSAKHRTVVKTRYSGFFKTGLAEMLHDENVERVVVVGAYTHYCVNATVFDAWCHDFIPGIVTDGVLSHLEEESRIMIERMRRNGYHVYSMEEFLSECKGDQ